MMLRPLLAGAAAMAACVFSPPSFASPKSSDAAEASRMSQLSRIGEQTDASLAAIEAASMRVRVLLQTARAGRDALEIACVGDKLTKIDVAMRVARDHATRAQLASGKVDVVEREQSRWELVRLEARRDAARGAAREAAACIARREEGGGASGGEETRVRMFIDEILPDGVTDYPSPPR